MSQFTITTTPIEGLLIIEPTKYGADREFFFDLDNQELFASFGIPEIFIDNNIDRYPRGVIKGLHFQRENSQAKLITALTGAVLDVAVDLRPESKTYGASHAIELSEENERMFYIPPRFAHGFLSLEAGTELAFKCSNSEHIPSNESGVMWNDQVLAINWQFERYDIDEKWLNIDRRDKKQPSFWQLNPANLWVRG
ncbi:MAG: dTDP-4-dehydrorhamnose 3,5-epimerase [Rikenellaceae bacterium]